MSLVMGPSGLSETSACSSAFGGEADIQRGVLQPPQSWMTRSRHQRRPFKTPLPPLPRTTSKLVTFGIIRGGEDECFPTPISTYASIGGKSFARLIKLFSDGSITACDGDEMSQSSSGAPGWQLEGNGPLAYDTHIANVFLHDYSRRLVEVAAIKPGDRVLDVACGTGVVTRLVANKIGSGRQVVGFDLNAGMLARASRETAAAIEWRLGNATDMPFADATFDCVICQHGLQFIPNKAATVSEMHRVLADRGRIVISVWRS